MIKLKAIYQTGSDKTNHSPKTILFIKHKMGYRGYSIFMEKIPPVASAEIQKELKYQIRVDITIGMTQLVLGKLPTGDYIPHWIKIKPNY